MQNGQPVNPQQQMQFQQYYQFQQQQQQAAAAAAAAAQQGVPYGYNGYDYNSKNSRGFY